MAELPHLQYSPLPTPTSIRLLEILPVLGPEIHCSLIEVDLDDNPVFDALSYTWGNPITIHEKPRTFDFEAAFKNYCDDFDGPKRRVQVDVDVWQFRAQHPLIPYEKVEWDAERRCRLVCNGEVIMVTPNLFEALIRLHLWHHGKPEMKAEFDASHGPLSRHLWVDMVCINQEDVDERNSQIRIMGRIFESARTVIGWLGAEANLSRHASAAIGTFLRRVFEADDSSQIDEIIPPGTKSLFCLEGISESDAYAIFALFQRLWFRRAWIIQEAVLAENLILACGGVMIRWLFVEIFVRLLHERYLYRSLSVYGFGFMNGKIMGKGGKPMLKAGFETLYSVVGDTDYPTSNKVLQVDPLEALGFVTGVGDIRNFLQKPQLPDNRPSKGRLAAGTDDDRLAAAEGSISLLNKKDRNADEDEAKRPGWHELLLGVCRSCAATDPRDKIFSLFGLLEKTGSQLSGIPWDYRTTTQELYRLTVLAIIQETRRLDILSQVQDPSRTKLSGLPSWVPDFSVSLGAAQFERPGYPAFSASGSTSYDLSPSIGPGIPTRLHVDGFFIDNVIDVAALKGCYFARTARIVSRLPARYHPKRHRTKQDPTRSEAYFRTLVGGPFDENDPKVLKMGFGFSEWIISELGRALVIQQLHQSSQTRDIVDSPEVLAYFEKLHEKFKLWKALMKGEPEEYIHINTTTAKEVYVTPETRLRFIPDEAAIQKCISPTKIECPNSSCQIMFMSRMLELKRGHRMFRTPNNYLGMGPTSSQIGDEVWVLKGARTPFILRRKEPGRYQVIGEAYVHGIMHGEALQGSFEPTPLELV
ncbi:heterokaryon incompatibility protein-domain-containing protein [Podospora aff. communis PSN243]|uniref:Heterokaryon incompatibility protein-domain-containing protein n=1 Tax=Podospora aff. communis PSN243 TaxID=3040156 RepID=A0AAV9GG58_9PEZI|nr:heterokaryon incompatibility protein-domain-containing protein [Podospora aff. communis PSN243]